MQFRSLGQSGIQASGVGLGAWAIGGWMWGGTEEARSIHAIQAAIEAGINLIDTAPAYGMGLSETLVGRAIAGRRSKVILATKCGLVWHDQKGKPYLKQDGNTIYRYLGPDSIRYEVEQSLRRLGVDAIDLLQTHWQDETTPIEETMAALLDLKKQGKIRAIGVSNCRVEQLEAYRRLGPVDSAQEKYSMLDRAKEAEFLPYCLKNNIAFLAYSPLSNGLLTGKVSPLRQFPPSDLRHNHPRFTVENREAVQGMLKKLEPVASKHRLTLSQLVIAWTASQPGVTHVLAGVRDEKQARENAAAGAITLSPEDLETIGGILRQQARPAGA